MAFVIKPPPVALSPAQWAALSPEERERINVAKSAWPQQRYASDFNPLGTLVAAEIIAGI